MKRTAQYYPRSPFEIALLQRLLPATGAVFLHQLLHLVEEFR